MVLLVHHLTAQLKTRTAQTHSLSNASVHRCAERRTQPVSPVKMRILCFHENEPAILQEPFCMSRAKIDLNNSADLILDLFSHQRPSTGALFFPGIHGNI